MMIPGARSHPAGACHFFSGFFNKPKSLKGNHDEGWRDVIQPNKLYSRETESEICFYRRQFKLVEGVEWEKITASYHNGVLRVTIPKTEDMKPKKIKIKSA